jgi:diguanylate cyclase (GGDEF)-like protein
VNDQHGHLQGDKVLCAVARVLQDSLRSQDIAGRWGGEEFLVLLPSTASTPALVLAERLRANVASACHVTVSIGLHTMHGLTNESADAMLDTADRALYAAKHRGRNCVGTSLHAPA